MTSIFPRSDTCLGFMKHVLHVRLCPAARHVRGSKQGGQRYVWQEYWWDMCEVTSGAHVEQL
jgi:hypothetical protein